MYSSPLSSSASSVPLAPTIEVGRGSAGESTSMQCFSALSMIVTCARETATSTWILLSFFAKSSWRAVAESLPLFARSIAKSAYTPVCVL